MTTLEKFKDILIDNHLRITESRVELFKLLLGNKPLGINEIINKLDGVSDRVSVYRNMELFEKLGVAKKVFFGWKYKIELSELFIGHHHHLICLGCGVVFDIEGESEIDSYINEATNRFGFNPTRHTFEIEGYCKNCS